MKKHLLMLILLSNAKAEKVISNQQADNIVINSSEKSLPVLRTYEDSLPVLKAYEELLPVLKTYEEYFTVLEKKQKKVHDYNQIELKKANESFKAKALKIAENLKSKSFKMEKTFSNDLEIEKKLNMLFIHFKTAYLNYLKQIEKLSLFDQEKKQSIIEANTLYKNTIKLIKNNYPIEEQIQKLKKQKKAKNQEINQKIKSLRFEQNEKIRRIESKPLKNKDKKLKSKKRVENNSTKKTKNNISKALIIKEVI